MTDSALSLDPSLPTIVAASAATLGVLYAVGWLLLSRNVAAESKLLRLGLILTSGLLCVTSVTATLTIGRMCYLAVIPIAQILHTIVQRWRQKRGVVAVEESRDKWTTNEIAMLAVVTVVCASLFHLGYERVSADGDVIQVNDDLGYLVQQVISTPQAGVASLWSPTLGARAVDVADGHDVWYHWGSIFLAIAIRWAAGIPGMSSLLDVSCTVLNVILVIVAGAVFGGFLKMPVQKMLAVGALSVAATTFLNSGAWLAWLQSHLPYGSFQHTRVSLALFFAYKFEAIVMFAALGAWLKKHNAIATLLLFCGAVSSPHAVAACGVTATGLGVVGIILRDRRMLATCFTMIGTLLAAWGAIALVFHAAMAGGGTAVVTVSVREVGSAIGRGAIDALIGLALNALFLPGIIHLTRASDDQATEQTRMVGWMAFCGIVGSSVAFHFLHRVTDGFHVMVFVQTILVMPAGIWGLARMASLHNGAFRHAAIGIITASVTLGVYDLVAARCGQINAVWSANDLEAVKQVLHGRPFGYYSHSDRGWWISKYAVLGGMIESRCVRINPAIEEAGLESSRFYGYTKPFQLVPPEGKESNAHWSQRFVKKLGIRHVVETWEDRLPQSILANSRMIASVAGLRVYELNDPPNVAAK